MKTKSAAGAAELVRSDDCLAFAVERSCLAIEALRGNAIGVAACDMCPRQLARVVNNDATVVKNDAKWHNKISGRCPRQLPV